MKPIAVVLPATPSSFRRVAGLPLIVRLVLTAYRCGAGRVVLLGGSESARLRAALAADARIRAATVCDDDPGALDAAACVAILPSDCLVTPAALESVFAAGARGGFVVPAAGIVVGPPELVAQSLARAERAAGETDDRCELPELHCDRGWCMRVRDAAGAAAAERRLVADLRAASAESDGPIARFDRALSTRLSRLLVKTPLRPNHLTLAGTAIGLLAAWCIATGTYAGGITGALLFWLAVIIDGCDGEVARLKMQESRFGRLFDVVTDNVVHVAIFLAIGIGQYRAAPSEGQVLLAALLLSGLACALVASYVVLVRHPPVRRLEPRSRRGRIRKRLLLGFEAMMNRDFAYVLLPLALLGRLHWFLWGAGIGSHAFTIGLFVVYRWREEE
jgi:phosphatidylglycerophosphate synthase